MNRPNNKRKRESKNRIEKVFIDLLQDNELNQIRVSDICQRAQVNRSTFYAHYDDIFALADSIREKLENNVAELYRHEITEGFNSNNYLKLFIHIRDNPIFYKTYFKLGYDDNYQILAYDIHLAEKYFQNRFIEYHMEFFKSGLTKIIKMWLQNGCQETPEDLFEIIKSEYRGREEFLSSKTQL